VLAVPRALSDQSAGAYGAAELGRIEEEMSRRPRRMCEVCTGESLPSGASRVGRRALVCVDCEGELRRLGRDLETVLSDLSRLRYIELRHPTLEELLEYDRFNHWQRTALDGAWGRRPSA
jgi:hypothetical protein